MIDLLEPLALFPGKSELAKLMRSLDWSQTDFPPVSTWPEELFFSIKFCLTSNIPIAILWGSDFLMLYNDAYKFFLDKTKHPFFLGKPGFECWEEIWPKIFPSLQYVYTNGEATKTGDIQLIIQRDSYSDELYVNFTFWPILDLSGNILGIFSSCENTSDQVIRKNKTNTELNIMNHLHSIATRFVEKIDINAVLLEIIDAAICTTHADKGSLYFVNEDETTLNLVASRGFSQPFLDHFAVCNFEKGTCGKALESAKRVVVDDITKSSIFVDTPDLQPLLEEKIRAVQSTILKNRSGKILGVLSTHYEHVQTPKKHSLQMLDLLCQFTADIIEKERWIQERAKWIEKMREADRRKDIFLAILSHELRNPLAAISNSNFILSQARTTLENTTIKNAQDILDRQLKKIIRLVDELLEVTRITQNKIRIKRQCIDLNKIVYASIADNQSLFENRKISVETNIYPYPLKIDADPIRITQIVSNLLQNACKFSRPGGVTKIITQKKEHSVEFKIIDDGIGIDPNLLDHLFEPFMQADESLDRSNGGIGLGLALVKGFTELHDGNVSVKSAGPGCGSEFTISLPIGNINETTPNLPDIKPGKSPIHRCVLIIEDNNAIAESLAMVLDVFGHTTYISNHALEGIQKAKQLKPDFIFCDIGLPEIDGYEVAKNIKADSKLNSTFLVALSGYAQHEDIEKSLNAGFDLHLAKPPNIANIKQLLEKDKIEQK